MHQLKQQQQQVTAIQAAEEPTSQGGMGEVADVQQRQAEHSDDVKAEEVGMNEAAQQEGEGEVGAADKVEELVMGGAEEADQ